MNSSAIFGSNNVNINLENSTLYMNGNDADGNEVTYDKSKPVLSNVILKLIKRYLNKIMHTMYDFHNSTDTLKF